MVYRRLLESSLTAGVPIDQQNGIAGDALWNQTYAYSEHSRYEDRILAARFIDRIGQHHLRVNHNLRYPPWPRPA